MPPTRLCQYIREISIALFLQIQSDVQSLFFFGGGGIQKQIMKP